MADDDDFLQNNNDGAEDSGAGTQGQQLPNDFDTPFTPADDVPGAGVTNDNQHTDTDMDEDETYNEGEDNAANINPPQNDGVVDYNPDEEGQAADKTP